MSAKGRIVTCEICGGVVITSQPSKVCIVCQEGGGLLGALLAIEREEAREKAREEARRPMMHGGSNPEGN